ncbi:hypothetical protein F5050DRAFT_1122285 [Lentinula boryana]|uniref:Uncharacterized protein n=1 Tax=Lentinula boryana TaxID=40481 RepID=A0ABQ8PZG7_9AGAR|nr:hypothetical protein F5050DRAFT_1122285 [Lentinula boryana]
MSEFFGGDLDPHIGANAYKPSREFAGPSPSVFAGEKTGKLSALATQIHIHSELIAMRLNPAYLLFALLSSVAYAARITARGGQSLEVPPPPQDVHVKLSYSPKLVDPQAIRRLKSILEYWIRNMKMFKLEKEKKPINPEPLDPLNIVIEDRIVRPPNTGMFQFWGPGVEVIPGFQGCKSEEDECFGDIYSEVVYFWRGSTHMYYVHVGQDGFGEGVEEHNPIA